MIKISIIIPVYNCQQYLVQCIKSIINQSLKELEIICIDDGSIDDSAQIIRNLMLEDKRIRLFRQKNMGAGQARNLALKKASGKYIAFLDADDFYIDIYALEQMFAICETKNVYVCGGLRKFIEENNIKDDKQFQDITKNIVLNYRDYQFDYNYQNFIFSRRFLLEKGIYFPNYRRFQDPPFLVRTLFYAKQFVVTDVYLYGYRISNMSEKFNNINTCDLLCGLRDNLIFAKKHNLNTLFNNTRQRLEFEYKSIILENSSSGNLDIIKLLLQVNQIICDQRNEPNYVIKPLYGLLKNMLQYEQRLIKKIEEENKIVVFGAGKFGKIFLDFLRQNHLSQKVLAFVVSNKKGNEEQIEGVPVITLQELKCSEEIFMFVTVRENLQEEVAEYLDKNQYKKYELVDDDFFCMVSAK